MVLIYLNKNNDIRLKFFNGYDEFVNSISSVKKTDPEADILHSSNYAFQSGEFANDKAPTIDAVLEIMADVKKQNLPIFCDLEPREDFKGDAYWTRKVREALRSVRPDLSRKRNSGTYVEDAKAYLDSHTAGGAEASSVAMKAVNEMLSELEEDA